MKITKRQLRRIIREAVRSNLLESYEESEKQQYAAKIDTLLSDGTPDSYRIVLSIIDAMADKDPDFANELIFQMSMAHKDLTQEHMKKSDLIYHGPRDPNERLAWKKARAGAPGARQLIQKDEQAAEELGDQMAELDIIMGSAMDLANQIQWEMQTGKVWKQGGKSSMRFKR